MNNTKEVKDTTLMGKKKQELVEMIKNRDRAINNLVIERKAATEQCKELEKENENLKAGLDEYASQNVELMEHNIKFCRTRNCALVACGILAVAFIIALM